MFDLINYIGAGFILTVGITGVVILVLLFVEIAWNKWTETTKKTVWFFDYMKHRREFEFWLKEKETNKGL